MEVTFLLRVLTFVGVMALCQPESENDPGFSPVISFLNTDERAEMITPGPNRAAKKTDLATPEQQQEVLEYINQARSKSCRCGSTIYPAVPALTLDNQLNAASDNYAVDMATYNYFSHNGRNGSRFRDRITREGYLWRTVGENISAGYSTPRSVVDGWLKSPGHCANIMSATFKNVGVGYGYNAASKYKYYWVTDFGTRR